MRRSPLCVAVTSAIQVRSRANRYHEVENRTARRSTVTARTGTSRKRCAPIGPSAECDRKVTKSVRSTAPHCQSNSK
jgi:hypothetical protein